ncbi:hypothetical protein CIPAW_16G020300 [Carya illinoinensis]|uniref:Uncharacterized protein n=1 Tax=Carya illinoinensis TaxID=32201 RepID=A0A8T1N525_CARIL|nr:hypothetical protein CIPAW_16G020300 [Carya illinoinensis]
MPGFRSLGLLTWMTATIVNPLTIHFILSLHGGNATRILRVIIASPTSNRFYSLPGDIGCITFSLLSKNPAYVRVYQQLQLEVVLHKAFVKAAVAPETGVALNKLDADGSTTTTRISTKE